MHHLQRLSASIVALLQEEERIASESARKGSCASLQAPHCHAPGKAWADMMAVLQRVADAGAMMSTSQNGGAASRS